MSKPGKDYALVGRWWKRGDGGGREMQGEGKARGEGGYGRQSVERLACGTGHRR